MLVRNIEGTSDNTCRCGSWMTHWERFAAGRSALSAAPQCSIQGCSSYELLGAHAQKNSSGDNGWYIVPLCASHNQRTSSLSIRDDVPLAPANVSQTCGK